MIRPSRAAVELLLWLGVVSGLSLLMIWWDVRPGTAADYRPEDGDASSLFTASFLLISAATALVLWLIGNPALARETFTERWRAEAGRLGAEIIPEEVRGLAYVQLHPVGDDPPFDAVNQAWFDDEAGLRRRAEWFAARPVPADLFDPASTWALHLRVTLR